ncbi:MAG: DUF5677 domain-containing protein [Elusimicrobiota bacterium]|jgi:hypothetical protein
MDDPIKRIGSAKTAMDHGFSRVGPELDPKDDAARALLLLACRAVAVSNALMVLARRSLANEALPLARSLLELTVHMRWIAAQDSAARAREFFQECGQRNWEGIWSSRRLRERCSALGIPAELSERVEGWSQEHVWGNASGLPWAHVLTPPAASAVSGEALTAAAADMMAEALAALEQRWPGRFT